MISLDTRSFSPRLSVLSYPAISANACLVTLILSHVSFISFLTLKHLYELAILAMRTHVCRALVRVCTYSFFQLCIVSSILALSAHANARISSSHTHARVRASACRRVCVHFFSPERLLLLFIYAGISLTCLWHSAQPSGCASRVLLTGPENRFASGRGFDSTIRRVRNEQQDLNELYSIFLQYGPLISYGSQ